MAKRKIKILHVINDLGIGGAQRIVSDIVSNIDRKKFKPIVYNLNFVKDKTNQKIITQSGVKVIDFQALVIGDFRCIWPLLKIVKKEHIDIVHTHLCLASLFATIAARLASVKTIISTEHNTSTFDTRPWLYRIAARVFLSLNCHVIAISQAVKQVIERTSKRAAQKTKIIYNGINDSFFEPDRYNGAGVKQKTSTSKYRVGTFYRSDSRKGFDYFARCAEMMGTQNHEIEFVAAVNSATTFNEYPNVRPYVLNAGKEGVGEFLSIINVFVLPSLEEGLGIAALEAMAMQKPVVVSDVGGLKEVVKHEIDGLRVPCGDVEAMSRAITRLRNEPGFSFKLGKNARRSVEERFTLKRMIRQVEELYEELV